MGKFVLYDVILFIDWNHNEYYPIAKQDMQMVQFYRFLSMCTVERIFARTKLLKTCEV